MPQADSVIHAVSNAGTTKMVKPTVNRAFVRKDTTAKVMMDSVLLKDSLMRADSIHRADSLKILISAPKKTIGYVGKNIPAYPHNTPWVFGTLFFLLLLLTVSLQKSAGAYWQNIKSFFKTKEASSFHTVAAVDFVKYRIYSAVFSLAVFALYFYSYFYNPTAGAFGVVTFGKFLALTLLFYLFKLLSFEFIGQVFFNVKQLRTFKQAYFGLAYALSVILFFVLIIKTYHPANLSVPLDSVVLSLFVVFYILLLIKVFQIFYTKLLDVLYIFLYLCTLEILPLLVVFWVYSLIV